MNDKGIWNLEEATEHHINSEVLAEWLVANLDPKILVNDFGCGLGFYSHRLSQAGFNVHAYEGTPGIEEISVYKPIHSIDLSVPTQVDKGQVICFEVGEHIPLEYENIVLDNICNNSNGKVILSWALPYQGGLGHVNLHTNQWVIEQMWWRNFELDWEASNALRALDYKECVFMIWNT